MALELPITRDEFLAAVRPTFERPENARMVRAKPRASGLASDARAIAYMMAGAEEDGYEEAHAAGAAWELDSALTQEQGRKMEELSEAVLLGCGLWLVDTQVGVTEELPYTRHSDGQLAPARSGEAVAGIRPNPLGDGLIWGYEHKYLGRYGYERIMKVGLEEASPEYILQVTLYGHAFGWDACLFMIQSQDGSAVRGDMTANRRAKPERRWVDPEGKPWQHPKVMLFAVDLRPLYETLLPAALARAEWFVRWAAEGGDPRDVQLEHNPYPDEKGRVAFPWSYLDYIARAQRDGQSGKRAPALAFTGKWE